MKNRKIVKQKWNEARKDKKRQNLKLTSHYKVPKID